MPLTQISEKRLAANRANARKSTGPRTAAGKAKVADNARRTGAYSEDHRMPPRIEAHFRALAEARTQNLADPTLRDLTYEWHMLQGHLTLHDSRERALFNAGLEYGRGNEDIARDWVLRQHGFIQALNRYAGWIQMRLRRVEAAILATPAGLDHLTQLLAASAQPGPAEPATPKPTTSFEGTNPLPPDPPKPTLAGAATKESSIPPRTAKPPQTANSAANCAANGAATVRERITPPKRSNLPSRATPNPRVSLEPGPPRPATHPKF